MSQDPACPKCQSEYTYADGNLWICPSCGHEWSIHDSAAKTDPDINAQSSQMSEGGATVVRDAHGNILADGDSVTIIKELRIKGSSSVVKVGTKVRNIRLVDGDDDHNISCKIDGLGSMNLKSEFVKKA